jgi:hypothetical protein
VIQLIKAITMRDRFFSNKYEEIGESDNRQWGFKDVETGQLFKIVNYDHHSSIWTCTTVDLQGRIQFIIIRISNKFHRRVLKWCECLNILGYMETPGACEPSWKDFKIVRGIINVYSKCRWARRDREDNSN